MTSILELRQDLHGSRAVVAFDTSLVPHAQQTSLPQFVGDAKTFKTLFGLPLAGGGPATLAVHRAGNALIVDAGGAEPPAELPSSIPSLLKLAASGGDAFAAGLAQALPETKPSALDATTKPFEPPGSLRRDRTRRALRAIVEAAKDSQKLLTKRREEETASAEAAARSLAPTNAGGIPRPPRDYARVLAWRLRDMRIVSGSDAVLCDDGSFALRLMAAEDAACPRKRRLAVLDYWLDNVLAGVPRLALCLEARGAVVGGKMVDTSEIPRALSATGEDALFDTASVELHAAALLRFLAKHCDRDGANYVLARDDGASPLRLYCLDSLADAKQRHWKWLLATLSARFAARIGAHLAAGDGFDAAARRALRRRQRLLLATGLGLLGEIEDLGGDAHALLRASLEEQRAASYLVEKAPGYKAGVDPKLAEDRAAPLAFFGGAEQDPAPGFDALRHCGRDALQKARESLVEARRFADYARGRAGGELMREGCQERVDEFDTAALDCSLALAKQHLESRAPSELMHELKAAAGALGPGADARRAALWFCAAAYARGIAVDRFAWSDRGALAGDALGLLRDLDDAGGGDGAFRDLDVGRAAGPVARAALERDAEDGRRARFARDAAQLKRACGADAALQADRGAQLGASLALALSRALAAARGAFGPRSPEARALAARLGAACNDVGARLSAQDAAGDAWLWAALSNVRAGEDSGANEARVRLNLAVAEKRRAAALLARGGDATPAAEEAVRHCEAAADAVGLRSEARAFDAAHGELAAAYLLLGVARKKKLFLFPGGDRADEARVLEPLEAALRARNAVDPQGPGAAAARFQLGCFLAARVSFGGPKRRGLARGHLAAAARAFLGRGDAAPGALASLELAALLADGSPSELLAAVRALAAALMAAPPPDLATSLDAALKARARDLLKVERGEVCKRAYAGALRGDAAAVVAALEGM